MLLLNNLEAVFKLPICNLLVQQNILQHQNLIFQLDGPVLDTMVYLETLHHYVNNGSNVYSGLLDASRAFDRINYEKEF